MSTLGALFVLSGAQSQCGCYRRKTSFSQNSIDSTRDAYVSVWFFSTEGTLLSRNSTKASEQPSAPGSVLGGTNWDSRLPAATGRCHQGAQKPRPAWGPWARMRRASSTPRASCALLRGGSVPRRPEIWVIPRFHARSGIGEGQTCQPSSLT